MLDGYYYCLNCHSEITPDYNEHCTFCGCSAVAVSGDYSNEEVERAFDLLNKEQQGLVIVPPCKVGDTLYVISQMRDKRILPFINEYKATSIKLGKKKCIVYHEVDGYIKIFKQDDFGKTVFLTREEAEKALKGGVDNG